MTLNKSFNFIVSILIISLFMTIALGCIPRTLTASNLLPNVTPEMEDPNFWIKKITNPSRLLLSSETIYAMNEENLKNEELFLCKVKNLKEEWSREVILTLLDEDWEGFGKTNGVQYGRNGYPLTDSFWDEVKNNINQESLKEKTRILFGLIVKRTYIRVFPTEELSMVNPTNYEFDRFQHSSVSPGSMIGIYHFSRNNLWAYIQTGFIRGWVQRTDLAIGMDKKDALNYEEAKDRLVVTGSFVKVFGSPSLQDDVFLTQMGNSFPIIKNPENSGEANQCYVIKIPFRATDGSLTFRKGYIPKSEDVHLGFLPYTQENLTYQAFKMLHQPYGWGEMFGARDCSRFIMDIFSSFGIIMPRNSKFQARIGIPLGQIEGKTIKEKQRILDHAIPLATTLRLPGHIMLYLGKIHGSYYAIHNIWGIEKTGWLGPKLEKIGRVVVSDLDLGHSGPRQSLLHRITDIQTIGSP